MSTFRYTAFPDDPYKPFKRKKRKVEDQNAWAAPEHYRVAKNTPRAYPVAHDGRIMKELGRELVQDKRPEIMQPKREPIFLGLDQSSSSS